MTKIPPSQSRPRASSARLGKVAVLATAIAAFASSSAQALVLDTGTLVIAPTGVLDLKNNNLIVRTGSEATLIGYLTTGYSAGVNGYYDGPGINSSTAANDPNGITGVGILDNAEYGYANDWPPLEPGHNLVGTEILVKYTYNGDSDLSGTVTFDDYLQFLGGFNQVAPAKWFNGDYDYSGTVVFDDYLLFLGGFNAGGPPLSPAAAAAAVPEPASLGLLMAGVVGLMTRRNRRS